MTKAMNTEAIAEATGQPWERWVVELEIAGPTKMTHAEIANFATKIKGVTGWWAQGIAVAFEQHVGRRKSGQTSVGSFTAS